MSLSPPILRHLVIGLISLASFPTLLASFPTLLLAQQHSEATAADLLICVGLLALTGIICGLIHGFIDYPPTKLEIIRRTGTPSQIQQAEAILALYGSPVILSISLLTVKGICAEALAVYLHKVLRDYSTIAVGAVLLVFTEIIPCLVLSHHFLSICSGLGWFVGFCVIITYPLAWPLAKVVKFLYGLHHDTFWTFEKMIAIIQIEAEKENLTKLEEDSLGRVLKWRVTLANEFMRDVQKMAQLQYNEEISLRDLSKFLLRAPEFIPVFEGKKFKFILSGKELDLSDLEDPCLVSSLMSVDLPRVDEEVHIPHVLDVIRNSRFDAALVLSTWAGSVLEETGLEDNGLEASLLPKSQDVVGIIFLADILDTVKKNARLG